MIVDCAYYEHGTRQQTGPLPIERAAAHAASSKGFVWLGIHDPDAEELGEIARLFPLHPLAVEDAHHEHQRAKIERYPEHYFVVLRTAAYEEPEPEREVVFGEIHVLRGRALRDHDPPRVHE